MNKETGIKNRLKSDYELLTNKGYKVVGVFLQGSQNYELDYENSDIDTKAIVLPSFEDIVLGHKMISTTLVLPSNEHVDIKDIRLMFECFKKQNINFIEILFTKYYYLNPEFADLYQPMLDHAEDIAHYNNYAAVNCIAGMIFEKRAALTHRYEGLADKIDKYGYDSKQLHHIIRCEEFLKRYIAGIPYKDCLISKQKEHLIDIKANNDLYSKEQAEEISDNIVAIVKDIKEKYMQETPLKVNQEVEQLMQNTLYNIIKASIIKELIAD